VFHTTAPHSMTHVEDRLVALERDVKEPLAVRGGRVGVADGVRAVVALVRLKFANLDHSIERELVAIICTAL
jgi:hypothetical protein